MQVIAHSPKSNWTAMNAALIQKEVKVIIKVSENTSWNWGYLYTEHEWEVHGHGGQEFIHKVRPVPNAVLAQDRSYKRKTSVTIITKKKAK